MPAADWQPDPTGRHEIRRRNPDGTWTDQVADRGVLSRDPYDGIQPEPVAPPEPEPELEPAPEPEHVEAATPATVAPVTVQIPAAAREPLGFWQTAFAVAFGVLIAGAVGLLVLSALAARALEDLL